MSAPPINAIFEYMALLVSERDADEPFLLSQIQPALTFKFGGFSFATYGLANLKDFLAMGEKAGYFKLVNTGNVKTMYLAPGAKRPQAPSAVAQPTTAPTGLGAEDPRRNRWMTDILEALLNADRADQIANILRGSEAFNPMFDAFLASQERTMQLYYVRGKVRRLRAFIRAIQERGETAAMTTWQKSRTVLHLPPVPPLRDAVRYGGLIARIIAGEARLGNVAPEMLDNLFVAVIRYLQYQLNREKALDWLLGLEILEAEVRAIPRQKADKTAPKRGLFGAAAKPAPANGPEPLDDGLIAQLTQELMRQAGIRATHDDTALWNTYAASQPLEAGVQFLETHADLLKNDHFVAWLDEQLKDAVATKEEARIRNFALKAALVLTARQVGLANVRTASAQLREINEAILQSAQILGVVLGFLATDSTDQATTYLHTQTQLFSDPSVGELLDEQAVRVAKAGDVPGYRRVTDRIDLWQHVGELGAEDGLAQHIRYLNAPRDDKILLTEMGLLLLKEAESVDDRRDVLESYPMTASPDGLAMINGMLDILSFQRVEKAEYDRHYEVKRLIERCLQIGIDRAIAELK